MGNRSGSKSILFLIEQLIVILVFAVCAAVCVRIFFVSYTISGESSDINNAASVARNGAECYKAAGGDAGETAGLLGGVSSGSTVTVYYDGDWQVCGEDIAVYIMRLSDTSGDLVNTSGLSVEKISGGEIIAFTVAARRDAS